MLTRLKGHWLNISQSLGFVPGLLVVVFGALGVVLVQVDQHVELAGVEEIFGGDASAARTVLSVIAGSLITVAGLTFSTTIVVLQLASSQFSPRVLRTFFGDRLTQITIGTYVGTFVYALLVLRSVGSLSDPGFVPRLSVTVASLLGIAAVVLLILFLHHVSQMVQVSHVTADIAHATLARLDALLPQRRDGSRGEDHVEQVLERWRMQESARLVATRPGYVQRVDLDALAAQLTGRAERVSIAVCAGDFVSVDTAIAEIWPASAEDDCRHAIRGAITIASERDLSQDVDFGLRQLADIALRALSPGVNDPMTAVTSIRYLRSILVRLAEHDPPAAVLRHPERDLTIAVRRRTFDEHLDVLRQVDRYANGDAWVIGELLLALQATARAARECGATERERSVVAVADTIAEHAAGHVSAAHDRRHVEGLVAAVRA